MKVAISIPSGWELVPLRYVAALDSKKLPESTPLETEILYVDISSVGADGAYADATPMAFGNAPTRARMVVRPGDVILSTVRTYLRAVAHFTDPPSNLIASTGFAVLSALGGLDSRFLYYWVSGDWFLQQVVGRSLGVSYPAIRSLDLKEILVAVPPADHQKEIAAYLDAALEPIDATLRLVSANRDNGDRTLSGLILEKRRALIHAAVTGRLGLADLMSADRTEVLA